MKEICIDEKVPLSSTGHSSKGNQLKWETDGLWYKADGLGYEGLSEVVVSHFLEHARFAPSFDFVRYEPVLIMWQNRKYDGCVSRNFRKEGWQIITVEKLYRRMTGLSIAGEMAKYSETEDRILLLVRFVRNTAGLEEFGKYLTGMLELDAFFLNEDRHTNNIAVLYNPKEEVFDYCPYFDFGAGLYSDILGDYPLSKDAEACEKIITAKPFSNSFDKQTDTAEELFGNTVHFTADRKALLEVWGKIRKEYVGGSVRPEADKIAQRVEDVLRMQIRKYGYFLKPEKP